MTVSAEFIASTGPYQHVKLVITATDGVGLMHQLDQFSDEMKQRLGMFEAELVSWASNTYDKAINGEHVEIVKSVASALGASVVEETDNPGAAAAGEYAEAQAAAAANRKPKAWETTPKVTAPDISNF